MRNEVLNGVFRKIASNFVIQLPCKRFVVTENQRWNVESFDHVGHSEGLTAPCNAEQDASFLTVLKLLHQFFNSIGLVTGRLEFAV